MRAFVLAVLVLLVCAPSAGAHATIIRTTPSDRSVVAQAPRTVEIRWSEAVDLGNAVGHVPQQLARFLQENPQRKVSIEGFTDSRGSEEYNQSLSERRADAVKTALLGLGISADRIVAQGFGEAFPVAENNTSAGQQLNRRVEIVISEAGQEIAPRR